jgi:hypothetical protein
MRTAKTFLAVFFLILYCKFASNAADLPKVPFIQHDICPFECCQYGRWIARTELAVYKSENSSELADFTIKPHEEFTAISGDVHIVKFGVVTLEKSFNGFNKGDKVYVLSYRGEGIYDLWYGGKIFESNDLFWTNGIMKQAPEIIWWVLVKKKNGMQGWLMLRNISERGFQIEEKIDGMDSCS